MKIAVLTRALSSAKRGKQIYPEEDYKGRNSLNDALAVADALKELNYNVEIVDGNEIFAIKERKFDAVFNVCDDGFKNISLLEPHIVAVLDMINIPYTGNNYLTLGWCLNKERVKKYLMWHGIPTPKFQVFKTKEDKLDPQLKFPLFVKPVHEDASIGIRQNSLCKTKEELKKKIFEILDNYKEDALVEEFIGGREFNVGIIGNNEPTALPVAEIDFSGLPKEFAPIVTYEAKWNEKSVEYKKTPVVCPAKIDEKMQRMLQDTAVKCYKILNCRGYARVDFRFDDGKLYVLEMNPNPDISADAGLANAAKANGWDYKELVKRILNYAIEEHNAKKNGFF